MSRRAHQEALSQTGRVAPPRLHTAPEISAIVPVRVHPPAVLCRAVPAVLLKISCFVKNRHPGWSTYLLGAKRIPALSAISYEFTHKPHFRLPLPFAASPLHVRVMRACMRTRA